MRNRAFELSYVWSFASLAVALAAGAVVAAGEVAGAESFFAAHVPPAPRISGVQIKMTEYRWNLDIGQTYDRTVAPPRARITAQRSPLPARAAAVPQT